MEKHDTQRGEFTAKKNPPKKLTVRPPWKVTQNPNRKGKGLCFSTIFLGRGAQLQGCRYLPMINPKLNLFRGFIIASLPCRPLARVTSTMFVSRCTLKATPEHCLGVLKCQQIPESRYATGLSSQMLHVGNIYLHFPLNIGIFHLM